MEKKYTTPDVEILLLASIAIVCQSTGEQFEEQQDVSEEFDWE